MDINTCFETTNEVRSLALYSHLLPALVALLLGWFAVTYAHLKQRAILFLIFAILLSIWLFGDLITWHVNDYYLVAAFWSFLDFVNILFYLVLVCFFYLSYAPNHKLSNYIVLLLIVLATPPLLITIAGLAVHEFDQPNCEMVGNNILAIYKLVCEWSSIGLITILSIAHIIKKSTLRKFPVLVLGLSSVVFLSIFSGAEFIATYTNIYEITLYALFSLPIFILILTYSITQNGVVRLESTNIALVKLLFAIFALVAAFNWTLADDTAELLTTVASTIVTAGFGLLLLRSAQNEATQRQQIEKLAVKLEKANVRLKEMDKLKSEFVSIASHQLRSPVTAIRGYASLLLENSYGAIPEAAKDPLTRIEESAKLMATSIEDYLNVSRIEGGNMKYNLTDINLRDETEHICDDLRPVALKSGLVLLFRSDLRGRGVVHADIGKVQQIIHNLINNAIKYTKQGSIVVYISDDTKTKRITVDITDTGIGMNEHTLRTIFQKFERAENANSVNVSGTGLGLYLALQMAKAMGGDISCHSDGDGKGSRFSFTLPLVM